MNYLIIFPTLMQIKNNEIFSKNNYFIIERDNQDILIKTEEKIYRGLESIQLFLRNKEIIVLCCNEEALYLFSLLKLEKAKTIFSLECLSFMDKWKSYNIFKEKKIAVPIKSLKPLPYPFIVKPTFGFGSVGVKKISSEEDIKQYAKNFRKLIENSTVSHYSQKYHLAENNILYEKEILNGKFFSVAFIVSKSNKIRFFPFEGVKKFKNCATDFYWTSFCYAPTMLDKDIYRKISKLLKKLQHSFSLKSGVFCAEIMYDSFFKKFFLIEFSPRIIGGVFVDIIKKLEKIDLEELQISLFSNQMPSHPFFRKKFNKIALLNIYGLDNKIIQNKSQSVFKIVKYSNIFKKNLTYQLTIKDKK